MRVANRTPPLHGHADFWRMQIDLKIGDAIKNIGRAFNRGAIDTVLDEGCKGRTRHDGLADDGMRPSDGIAFGVKPGGETVMPLRPIPAACQIIFTRPDDFHWSSSSLRNVHSFDDKVGGRIGSTAESAAEVRRVQFYFFWRK